MDNKLNVKVGDKVTVIFSVGVAHPLYNIPTEAVVTRIGGYNGKCIECKTLKPVHHDENPEGIFVFDKNWNFLRYETSKAYDEIWEGWIEKIVA